MFARGGSHFRRYPSRRIARIRPASIGIGRPPMLKAIPSPVVPYWGKSSLPDGLVVVQKWIRESPYGEVPRSRSRPLWIIGRSRSPIWHLVMFVGDWPHRGRSSPSRSLLNGRFRRWHPIDPSLELCRFARRSSIGNEYRRFPHWRSFGGIGDLHFSTMGVFYVAFRSGDSAPCQLAFGEGAS